MANERIISSIARKGAWGSFALESGGFLFRKTGPVRAFTHRCTCRSLGLEPIGGVHGCALSGPVNIRLPSELFATDGSLLRSVIVPLTLKLMRSMPVPAAQSPPEVSDAALALLIASHSVQNPLPDVLTGSVALLTVIMLRGSSEHGREHYSVTGQ